MENKEPMAMEAEKLPESSKSMPSSNDSTKSDSKKGGMNKGLLIGCGVVLLIIACIVCVIAVGGAGLFGGALSFLKNSDALVEYNNSAVDERDKVVDQLYETTNSYYYGLDLSEIETSVADLDAAITSGENAINALTVPTGGEPLADLNKQYINKIKELSGLIKTSLASAESVFDISEADYDAYQTKLKEVDDLNIQIAKKLNELAGYEAVPQSEIDKLEDQQNQ